MSFFVKNAKIHFFQEKRKFCILTETAKISLSFLNNLKKKFRV